MDSPSASGPPNCTPLNGSPAGDDLRSLRWPAEAVPQAPAEGEVRVWAINLATASSDVLRAATLLDEQERTRASRFHFEIHQNRFILARAALRRVLAYCAGVSPKTIAFRYGTNGKPHLATQAALAELHFNLTHSADLALVAVAWSFEVGVDVERVHPINDMDEMVKRFFCPAEIRVFASLPVHEKPAAFFNLWTRKEAWLKATGEGISHLLNKAEVSFLPRDPGCLRAIPQGYQLADWSLVALDPMEGYTGALCAKTPEPQVIARTLELN